MKREIELAKSWFVATQSSIMLVGFLFATGGILYTYSSETREISNWYFWAGLIVLLATIDLFLYGQYKLRKIKSK